MKNKHNLCKKMTYSCKSKEDFLDSCMKLNGICEIYNIKKYNIDENYNMYINNHKKFIECIFNSVNCEDYNFYHISNISVYNFKFLNGYSDKIKNFIFKLHTYNICLFNTIDDIDDVSTIIELIHVNIKEQLISNVWSPGDTFICDY